MARGTVSRTAIAAQVFFSILAMLILAMLPVNVHAGPVSAHLTVRQDTFTDEHLDSSIAVVGKITHEASGLFLFGGFSQPQFKWAGQSLTDIDLFSVGFGMQHRFNGLKIYGQVGYYLPVQNDKGSLPEALHYYAMDRLPGADKWNEPWTWPNWSLDISPGIGGEVGVEYVWDITDRFTIGVNGAWRILELNHYAKHWSDDYVSRHPGQWWEWDEDVNYGGASIGITGTIRFDLF